MKFLNHKVGCCKYKIIVQKNLPVKVKGKLGKLNLVLLLALSALISVFISNLQVEKIIFFLENDQ